MRRIAPPKGAAVRQAGSLLVSAAGVTLYRSPLLSE